MQSREQEERWESCAAFFLVPRVLVYLPFCRGKMSSCQEAELSEVTYHVVSMSKGGNG